MGEERNGSVKAGADGRRRKALAVVALLAVLFAASGILYGRYRRSHVSTDDAFVEGRVHAVASRVAGKVAAVLVEDNQPVRKGDALVRIDPEPFDVRAAGAASSLAAAEADLSAARSDLEAARSDLRAAEQDVAAAQAQLAQARAGADAARSRVALADARLVQARRDAERAAGLYARHAISRERNEKAETERDVAQAQRSAAGEELRLAEAAVPAHEAQVAQKEAVVSQRRSVLAQREARIGQQEAVRSQRRASLRSARLDAGDTVVTAPADGYVTRKSVEAGQVVDAGQALLAVADLSDVWVVANFKETQIGRLRPGQEARIRVDTYPGKAFRGKVHSLMAGTGSAFSLFPPQNASGNYVKVVQRVPVKIVLDRGEDPERVLRIGMSVVPTVLVR